MRLIILLLLLCAPSFAHAQTYTDRLREAACSTARRAEVGARLEALRAEDQADRGDHTLADGAAARDLRRRQEVSALFAEGCFTAGRDYHNAALIFQHGTAPDHFYQVWLWARRAVELGDESAAWLIPRAVDRYLMNSGYKQLYATNLVTEQFYSADGSGAETWCVWPNVAAFDDARRTAGGGATLTAQIERARRMNDGRESGVCPLDLPDPPQGLFPGVW